jgi:hypothetical protein
MRELSIIEIEGKPRSFFCVKCSVELLRSAEFRIGELGGLVSEIWYGIKPNIPS